MSKRNRLRLPPPSWDWSGWQRAGWKATANLSSPSRIDFNAGRGAGKDILIIRAILRDVFKLWRLKKERLKAAKLGNGKIPVMNPLVKVWVLAAQEANISQAWADWEGVLVSLAQEWGELVGESGTDWLFRKLVRESKFKLLGENQIEVEARLTATKGALRGPGVDFVHWTEYAHETVPGQLERSWKELKGTLTRAGRLGRVYTSTSPAGPSGYYYEELKDAFGEEALLPDSPTRIRNDGRLSADGRCYYHHADSYQNEFLTPEQVEEIKAEEKKGGETYRQERLAEFVMPERKAEAAFDSGWISSAMRVFHKPVDRLEGFQEVRIGVDIARFGDDFTVLAAVRHFTNDKGSHFGQLVHIERHEHFNGPQIISRMVALNQQFPGATFVVDDTGHRGYITDFAPPELRVKATQFSREKMRWVDGFRMLLQMRRLLIPSWSQNPQLPEKMREALKQLERELRVYVGIPKGKGLIEYRHPNGENDDTVDAVVMATLDLAGRIQREKVNVEDTLDQVGAALYG